MRRYWCLSVGLVKRSVSMKPSLTETMTSRNGTLLRECEHATLMVECELLR